MKEQEDHIDFSYLKVGSPVSQNVSVPFSNATYEIKTKLALLRGPLMHLT